MKAKLLLAKADCDIIEVRRCGCCGRTLPLTEFYRSKNAPSGRDALCMGCRKKVVRAYRERKKCSLKFENRRVLVLN